MAAKKRAKTPAPKPRNRGAQDTTLINNRATNKRIDALDRHVANLALSIVDIGVRLTTLEGPNGAPVPANPPGPSTPALPPPDAPLV